MNVSTPVVSNGVFELISQSGPMAKLVLLVLVAASVFSWGIILAKSRFLKRAMNENAEFLNIFWNSKSIDEIMAKCDRFNLSPIAKVFKGGVKELRRFTEKESRGLGSEAVDNIGRALMRSSNSEVGHLEKHVGWLATTASATPFIGLFGTVWGIMNSFQNIGASGSANLAVVAPGISEALITTAAGIAAAVPAVIAYNHITSQIKRMAIDMDCFTHDMLNIVQRSSISNSSNPPARGQS